MAHPDPYASYLGQARAFFEAGEVLKAGQIWQAILKKESAHTEAKAGLYQVRLWLEAQQAPPPVPQPSIPPAPSLESSVPEPSEPPTPSNQAQDSPETAPPVAPSGDGELPQLYSMNLETHVPSAVPKAIKRTQRSTGGEPVEERELPAEDPAASPVPALPVPDEDEVDRYIREGCTLFDMGEITAALSKWQAVLTRQPGHPMVLGYVNDARRSLGMSPLQAPSESSSPNWGAQAPVRLEDPVLLMKEAVQLEEMGLPEEALAKLRRVLELDPDHVDAKAYLDMYARTQGGVPMVAPPPVALPESLPPAIPAPPVPEDFPDFTPSTLPPIPPETTSQVASQTAPPPSPGPSAPAAAVASPAAGTGVRPMDAAALDQKLRQGERLLVIKHYEEALFAFQMVLMQDPGNVRARRGLDQAKAGEAEPLAPVTTPPGPSPAPPPSSPGPLSPPAIPAPRPAAPVQPPPAVTAAAPALRSGPEVANLLKDRSWWKRNPLILGASAGFLLGSLLAWWQVHEKEARLDAAVRAAREAASTPKVLAGNTADLKESPTAIRNEGESILQEDPVRAYHRALYLLRLNPSDATAAQLRERAMAAMANPPAASHTELQNQIQLGDLESAVQTANKLLQATPEDPALMAKAARLNAALAHSHAARESWSEAREALRRGRALFPEDKSWQARLKLLDSLLSMPKGDRVAWVAMLG